MMGLAALKKLNRLDPVENAVDWFKLFEIESAFFKLIACDQLLLFRLVRSLASAQSRSAPG